MYKLIIIFVFSILSTTGYSATKQKDLNLDSRLDPYCSTILSINDLKDKLKLLKTPVVNFYIYPEVFSKTFTGCQNTWLENGHKMVTRHYKNGELTWERGLEPKDILPFFCLYKEGKLIPEKSYNLKRCQKIINP